MERWRSNGWMGWSGIHQGGARSAGGNLSCISVELDQVGLLVIYLLYICYISAISAIYLHQCGARSAGGSLSCISAELEQVGLLVICYSRLLARRKYRIQKRHAYTLLLLRICQTWTVHQGGLAGRWMEQWVDANLVLRRQPQGMELTRYEAHRGTFLCI